MTLRIIEALKAFERAIEIKPDYYEAWNNKGVAHGLLGEHDKALEAFEKAVDIKKDYTRAWNNKGIAFLFLDNNQNALEAFGKAIEFDPNFAEAWNNKGVALDNLDDPKKALEAFEKATEIKPDYFEAWNNKGVIFSKLDEYKKALEAIEKAIKIKPDNPKAWYSKGSVLAHLKEYNNSIKHFYQAINLNNKFIEAHLKLADIFLSRGDTINASAHLSEANKIDENNPKLWILKGKLNIEKRNYDGAINSFEKAISLDLDEQTSILWLSFARFLKAELTTFSNDSEYQDLMLSIIRFLDKLETENNREIEAYSSYFTGYFFYKLEDYSMAKDNLKKCIRIICTDINQSESFGHLKTLRESAERLLLNIWDCRMKPHWWSWWLNSPVKSHTRKMIFSIISLILLDFFMFQDLIFSPPFNMNPTFCSIFIIFSIFILVSPSITRIKKSDIEIELLPISNIYLSPGNIEFLFNQLLEKYPSTAKKLYKNDVNFCSVEYITLSILTT